MNSFEEALKGTKGKESMIAEYCRHSTRSKHACIWLCIKRGRKYRLVDVPIHQNQHVIGLGEIGKHYSWWRRYSLYSVVGVEEIMVSMSGKTEKLFQVTCVKARVLNFDKKTQRISAAVIEFDVEENIARLEKAKEKALELGLEPGECGIDIEGQHHDERMECANTTWDGTINELYCKAKHLDELELHRDKYKWLTPLIEYYWQHGIDASGLAFLRARGFIYRYEYASIIFEARARCSLILNEAT